MHSNLKIKDEITELFEKNGEICEDEKERVCGREGFELKKKNEDLEKKRKFQMFFFFVQKIRLRGKKGIFCFLSNNCATV